MAEIKDLASVSNVEFWNVARKASPSFASHTSKGTSDIFTEKGFEALKRSDVNAINEYIGISLRVAFQMVNVARAKNPLQDRGLVQVYDTPNGGYVQRMAIESIRPITPGYTGLQDGDTRDPFVVRKPVTTERFFQQNFDYQSLITIQDFQIKQIFLNEYGMGAWTAGVMQALQNGYTIQDYENTLEALNKAIHSDTYTLQDTQNIQLPSWTDAGTADELTSFILAAKDLASAMDSAPTTSAYNAAKFDTVADASDHVLLVRPGLKNRIQVMLEVGAFNPDRLTLPWEIIEVQDFGGMKPYVLNDDGTTHDTVYPVYDQFGARTGWATTENATEADVTKTVYYDDPNEDVIAIVAQRGLIFENQQNPYTVTPIYNPRGMYQNYWANRPANGIVVDPYYDLVLITKPSSEA